MAWDPLPGETPITDISQLKIKDSISRDARGQILRSDVNKAEAANILKPFVKYLARKPSRRTASFELTWAQRLHEEMFGEVWGWAGRLRTCALNIGVSADKVEVQLYGLFDDLKCWGGYGVSVLEQAVRLHHKAVQIHPFENGNGRWARLLANIWLRLNGHPIVVWPEETVGAQSPIRDEYLEALRKADDGDCQPLFELHNRLLEPSAPPRRRAKAPDPRPAQINAPKSRRGRKRKA